MRYEIRAMSFGEILDGGFRIVRDHFSLLIGIASLVYLPLGLISAVLSINAGASGSMAILVGIIPMILVIGIAGPVVSAAITFAVGELYLGRSVSFGKAVRVGLAIMVPLLGTSLLSWLCIAAGVLLLIIPGIYMMLAFLLIWQIMVLERVFGMAALRRSRELMRGNLLRGAGVVFIGSLITGILNGVLQFALRSIPFFGPVVSTLAPAAGAAYTSTVFVLLYFDIRCRKEGFDIEHLTNLVAAEGMAGSPQPSVPPAA